MCASIFFSLQQSVVSVRLIIGNLSPNIFYTLKIMAIKPARILLNNEYRILGLMLFSLLAAIAPQQNKLLAQSFLIVHFGFFLLWQPLFKQQKNFSFAGLSLLVVLIFGYILWFNPWLNAFWVLVLLTLLTGRIFNRGFERAVYGYAVIILFLQLVLIITPQLFGLPGLSPSFQAPAATLILLSPLLLLFTPASANASQHVDFIRGFLVVLLIIFLCMGSALVAFTTQQAYIPSLVSSIIILSIFLLVTSLLWAPPGGIQGLAQLWEKYLLNIGGPFEQWINHIATEEAKPANRPAEFLDASLQYLIQQHWVCGVYWATRTNSAPRRHHLEGIESKYPVFHRDEKIEITIYTHAPIGPALSIHAKLILRVLVFYYRAKLQEQQIIRQAHLQAIYETGSKLTHDVKNILQSTQTMTQIINDDYAEIQQIFSILKKQIPLLSQRLQTTLQKLQSPNSTEQASDIQHGSLLTWWRDLQSRYSATGIRFNNAIEVDTDIPLEAFNTVAENLLENALNKQRREKNITIEARLQAKNDRLQFQVCDTGSPFPADKREALFQQALASEDGYGIGLYHSYKLAKENGYLLSLDESTGDFLCFTLSPV